MANGISKAFDERRSYAWLSWWNAGVNWRGIVSLTYNIWEWCLGFHVTRTLSSRPNTLGMFLKQVQLVLRVGPVNLGLPLFRRDFDGEWEAYRRQQAAVRLGLEQKEPTVTS